MQRKAWGSEPIERPVDDPAHARESGFTLLELLIVIVVLGVLAAVVMFGLQGVRSSAATAACQSDFQTTLVALNAYRAQMGGYPGGTGSSPVTDNDPGTPPDFTAGAAPQGVDAARAGGELLVAGATSPNVGASASLGPWLRQAPDNSGSYRIWVANDGSGTVQVLDAAGKVPDNPTHTASDCANVGSGSGAVTTTTAAPSTTTSTSAPTTTTSAPPATTTSTTTVPARQAPIFTSAASTSFSRGRYGTFTVTASGSPRPSLSMWRSLPPGLSFDRNTGVLRGTPRRSGNYVVLFVASNNVWPNAVQWFTVHVG